MLLTILIGWIVGMLICICFCIIMIVYYEIKMKKYFTKGDKLKKQSIKIYTKGIQIKGVGS